LQIGKFPFPPPAANISSLPPLPFSSRRLHARQSSAPCHGARHPSSRAFFPSLPWARTPPPLLSIPLSVLLPPGHCSIFCFSSLCSLGRWPWPDRPLARAGESPSPWPDLCPSQVRPSLPCRGFPRAAPPGRHPPQIESPFLCSSPSPPARACWMPFELRSATPSRCFPLTPELQGHTSVPMADQQTLMAEPSSTSLSHGVMPQLGSLSRQRSTSQPSLPRSPTTSTRRGCSTKCSWKVLRCAAPFATPSKPVVRNPPLS
jgi:hypothetical protein